MAKKNPAVEKLKSRFWASFDELQKVKNQFSEKGGAFDDDFPSELWTASLIKEELPPTLTGPDIDALAEKIALQRNATLREFKQFRRHANSTLNGILSDEQAKGIDKKTIGIFVKKIKDLIDYPVQWNPSSEDHWKWEEAQRRIEAKRVRVS